MTLPVDSILFPPGWLAKTVKLLGALAGKEICILCEADPADLMVELTDYNNLGGTDEPWDEIIERLKTK